MHVVHDETRSLLPGEATVIRINLLTAGGESDVNR